MILPQLGDGFPRAFPSYSRHCTRAIPTIAKGKQRKRKDLRSLGDSMGGDGESGLKEKCIVVAPEPRDACFSPASVGRWGSFQLRLTHRKPPRASTPLLLLPHLACFFFFLFFCALSFRFPHREGGRGREDEEVPSSIPKKPIRVGVFFPSTSSFHPLYGSSCQR